ncbi:hypothetical protein jhhlp_005126 [Lomentospora prolificans]|uniref:EthD domain-containing protein n=1 Tax=Lomentospora prolificans TaxID=41688 RepID=A0A2N3N7K1_9PEZI|nr:hypothetical protein jhhlp_005126 [Lomentospora prolificans]
MPRYNLPDVMPSSGQEGKLICLTICGYYRQGSLSEKSSLTRLSQISASTMNHIGQKYGIVLWTQVHNQYGVCELVNEACDSFLPLTSEIDCIEQVVFKTVEDYQRFKEDEWCAGHLRGDHEEPADRKRNMSVGALLSTKFSVPGRITKIITVGWMDQLADNRVGAAGPKDPMDHLADNRDGAKGLWDPKDSTELYQVVAIVMGALLSGAMVCISILTVPVILQTSTHSSQLLTQWVRMFYYGHIQMPSTALATFALYCFITLRRRSSGLPWKAHLAAGLVTLAIVPYTLMFMLTTNNTLFDLEAKGRITDTISLEDAKELVVTWNWLHAVRSMLPLVGALIGSWATFKRQA